MNLQYVISGGHFELSLNKSHTMDFLGLWICYYQMCTTSYVKNSAVYHLIPGQNLYGPHYHVCATHEHANKLQCKYNRFEVYFDVKRYNQSNNLYLRCTKQMV